MKPAQARPAQPDTPNPHISVPSRAWWFVARGIIVTLSRVWWRIRVVGKENIPKSGPFVMAPVHRSYVDSFVAAALVHRRMRFMGKAPLWKRRWSAALFTSLGAFPVDRGAPDRAAMRKCEEILAGGEPLVMFPEGGRRSGPVVQEIREGAVFVAGRAGVPIVPVGIGASEWALPKRGRSYLPPRITVVVGPVIEPPVRGESGKIPRREVSDVARRLKKELQALFDDAMRRAGRSYEGADLPATDGDSSGVDDPEDD